MNVLYLPGFGPILNSLYFGQVHFQTIFSQDETKVLNGIGGEMTFVWTSIETISMKTAEDLTDMFLMVHRVIRIDEDVI